MTSDPGSLSNLRDLALPPGISFWPLAPGAWILIAAAIALLAILIWRAREHYRARAPRRAAIVELRQIAAGIDQDNAAVVARVSSVMKRVAMTDYERGQIAPLSGEAWTRFVAGAASIPQADVAHRLLAYASNPRQPPDPAELRALVSYAAAWVREFHAPSVPGR